MRRFGGLWRVMPITFATFGLGYLAIIGFPFLSGYFTKDAIIEAAFAPQRVRLRARRRAALLGAGLTAFYMTRLMLMTFFGRAPLATAGVHPHESPAVMTVPMSCWPSARSSPASCSYGTARRVARPVARRAARRPRRASRHRRLGSCWPGRRRWASSSPSCSSAAGAAGGRARRVSLVTRRGPRRDLYADAINEALLMRPGQWLTRALVFFDNRGVDGVGHRQGRHAGRHLRRGRGRVQTGFVRSYALGMLGGTVVVGGACWR